MKQISDYRLHDYIIAIANDGLMYVEVHYYYTGVMSGVMSNE